MKELAPEVKGLRARPRARPWPAGMLRFRRWSETARAAPVPFALRILVVSSAVVAGAGHTDRVDVDVESVQMS